jgi:hypothetical protein
LACSPIRSRASTFASASDFASGTGLNSPFEVWSTLIGKVLSPVFATMRSSSSGRAPEE